MAQSGQFAMQVRLTKSIADKCQELADALGHSPTELANIALGEMFALCDHPNARSVPLLCELVDTARAHKNKPKPLVYELTSRHSLLSEKANK
jgi:hypothetical protein